jgi:hypothetical protein
MGLAEIAAGVEVTAEQRDHGVTAVDRTGRSLAERLAPHKKALPCSAETATTVLEQYAGGRSVGDAARAAGTAPVTAAKLLHLLGESVHPLGPTGRDIVQDWLAGRLSRSEAVELARATRSEFALAVYVETHDPIEGARAAVEGALAAHGRSREDPLEEARPDAADLV